MSGIKKYSSIHDNWLREHLEDGTYKELAERFNSEFITKTTANGLRKRADRLGLDKKLNRSHAVKGGLLNKKSWVPIGTERVTDGIVWVKVADERGRYNKKCPGGYTNGGNWRKKAYINWEKEYGSIPQGKRLIYLDGNSLNCDVDNLYFADVAIQMHLARRGWQSSNRELTLAGIKWLELHKVLKDLSKSKEV